LLEKHPDWYLRTFTERFNICPQAVYNMFVKLGIIRKKTFTYSEKSEEEGKPYVTAVAEISEENRVYGDEWGIKERQNGA
jgi:hypothetical protein